MATRLEQVAGRLTYARVVGALAILLIALGGGYSLAFSGSGTLQKGNKVGFTPGVNEPIRTIGGIGPLLGGCANAPGADMDILLQNHSGEDLVAFTDKFDESDSEFPTPGMATIGDGSHGTSVGMIDSDNDAGVLRIHVFPADGSKRPQAKLTVGVVATGNCSTSQVSVLDLTTEG